MGRKKRLPSKDFLELGKCLMEGVHPTIKYPGRSTRLPRRGRK